MVVYAFAAPILPGKTDEWRKFTKELSGARREKYLESRRAAGIQREQAFLQQTPQGDVAVVVLDCKDAAAAIAGMAAGGEFNSWFQAEVQRLHGVSLAEIAKLPLNELVVDGRA